jgi:hypothetical protein
MIPLLWLPWLPWIAWASLTAEVLGAMAEPLESKHAARQAMADLDRVRRDFVALQRARAR